MSNVDSQPPADFLSDLLGPLAIEGPPGSSVHPQSSSNPGMEGTVVDDTAIVPAGQQANSVQVPSITCIKLGSLLLNLMC